MRIGIMLTLRSIITGVLVLCFSVAFTQRNYYWVKLKDKGCSAPLLNQPSLFLSQKSIERRETQNIAITDSDLPLCEDYVNAIRPFSEHIKHRLKWFNMLVVQVNVPSNVDSIKALPFVDSIGGIELIPHKSSLKKFNEVYEPVDQSIVYPNHYGNAYNQIKMLNGDLLHQLGYKGKSVLIAVFDNGFINVNWIPGFDSVRTQILNTYDFVHDEVNVYDDGGHGTSVFSCIAANIPNRITGTAPEADFLLLESEDDNAEWIMEEYNWAAAAEYADSIGASIFSTSLGYTTFDADSGNHTYEDLDGNTTVITRASNMAFDKGILVINSAGNYGGNPWKFVGAPADGVNVLSIGAVDSSEVIAGFSSRGPNAAGNIKPDVCAQGVKTGVISSGGTVTTSGGTSFSCPVLAGCAACLWQAFPEKSNRDIHTAIVVTADRFWTPDNEYGYGIPNFYNAYLLLKTNYNGDILHVTDEVAVFPNPVKQTMNVSVFSTGNKEYKLEIFNTSGEIVLTKNYFVREGTFEIFSIEEVAALADGTYVIRLNGDKRTSHRIIKQN